MTRRTPAAYVPSGGPGRTPPEILQQAGRGPVAVLLLDHRGEREGAIVGLVTEKPAPAMGVASLKEVYLRHTAHRARMDYLSHVVPTELRAMPDSLDAFRQRAGQVTSVLDQILHKHTPPPPLL